jgi:hypothetical protein
MKSLCWVLVAVLAALGFGCSSGPAPLTNQDSTEYARTIKQKVLDFVQDAKKSPKTVGQEAAVLVEMLEVYPSQPVGEYKAILADLTEKCKQLAEAAKRSPGSAEVTKLLNEMAALANKLPGKWEKQTD